MSIDQISDHVENQTKEANPVTAETKTARRSIGGLVVAVLTALFAIVPFISPRKGPIFMDVLGAIWFIGVAVIMAVRAFRPPMGWKKGLATWFGSFMIGGAFFVIGTGAMVNNLSVGSLLAGAVFAVPGFFLLKNGFKAFVSPR